MNQALRAHNLFTRDTDYIVKDNRVIIIDEFTGRMMEGRRYGDGLHQALEAKERVEIQNENQTLASITFQNYFRMYPKMAGMTGTAVTESAEFNEIYDLEVSEIPTHLPMIRDDKDDEIYRTVEEKWGAVIEQIKECHDRQQPVLVGTTSIEKSELLSTRLRKAKIKHNVLNAVASIGVGLLLQLPINKIKKSLINYQGVKRRFTFLGNIKNAIIYDDYAHHPTEIKATLEIAKYIVKNKIIVVFQPHRYSRTKDLYKDFINILKKVDFLFITDIYSAGEKPLKGINSSKLAKDILKNGAKNVFYLKNLNKINSILSPFYENENLIIFMGAGSISKLASDLMEKMSV